MNLLFRVLYAQKCSSTHHKLAMDALRYLKCENSNDWVRLFLSEIQLFTDGAKAPDKKFKDFRNHVLHVADNFWGGAVSSSEQWYARLVEQLHAKDWARAVYCAGVLSHYVTDPLMPLHTGQTEDEGQVHKFIEWGTAKIYEELVATHVAARAIQNWKPPETVASKDWLAVLIIDGAQLSHGHYDVMIDHYDPSIGSKNAASGFDDICRASLAELLGWAVKALAFVIDQAIIDANVSPPKRSLALSTVLSGISTPLFWVTRKLKDKQDRKAVEAIWNELQATGKVIAALPEDDRAVREAHADEVLGISLDELNRKSVRKAGSKHQSAVAGSVTQAVKTSGVSGSQMRPPRFYLELHSPIVDAPSIGPKTAARLEQVGIHTIEQLVDANADDATDELDQRWITQKLFADWQRQATLMCRVPGLRGHDAQLLVAAGISRPEELRDTNATELLDSLHAFAKTNEGERILRGSQVPDLAEIHHWIDSAGQSRVLRAA
jgi:hypothetical protein